MESTFVFNLQDGRRAELVAEYTCEMVQETIYADGLCLPGKRRPSTTGSSMIVVLRL